MKKLHLIFYLWIILSSFSSEHALYFSVMELEIKDGEPSSLVIKSFTDDLQDVLLNYRNYELDEDALIEEDFNILSAYFNNKVVIKQNGILIQLKLIDVSLEAETLWTSFSVNLKKDIESSIRATQFVELFPAQKQMLQITSSLKKEHHILTNSDDFVKF